MIRRKGKEIKKHRDIQRYKWIYDRDKEIQWR
jgi:hypothetical protein